MPFSFLQRTPKIEDAKDEEPDRIAKGDVARFDPFHGRMDKFEMIMLLHEMQGICADYC